MDRGPEPAGPHAHGEHAHDHHGFAEAAAAIGARTRAQRWRTRALALVFTLAALTLLTELGLRLAGVRERAVASHESLQNPRWATLVRAGILRELPDPVRRYGLRPSSEAEVDGWRFRVSNRGTRGPDVPSAKPPAERRLLCLGDSLAFGMWCDEDETVVAELARLANAHEAELASDRSWRPLDLAVPGYHLGQTLRAFEDEGLALEPDLVVLYFNTNDIEQSGFFFDERLGLLRRDFLPLPVFLKTVLFRHSHLYGWIAARYAHAVEDGPTPYLEPRVPWAHVRSDNQAYTRAALARLAELCHARGLPLFVIHQPLMGYLGSTRASDWPVRPLEEWFEGVCEELELPRLDLIGLLRGYRDGVDRLARGAPPDFLPEQYIADEGAQAVLEQARAHARTAGEDWDALPLERQLKHFAGFAVKLPEHPDFHMTGAGYRHIARLAYERLRASGLLP